MVEVYKTNVKYRDEADLLLDHLQMEFPEYKINFDLEDCDNILRVECPSNSMDVKGIIFCLMDFGFQANVLSDEPQIQIVI